MLTQLCYQIELCVVGCGLSLGLRRLKLETLEGTACSLQPVNLLVAIKLALLRVAVVATGTAAVASIAIAITIADLLVADGWTVSVLVGLVLNNLFATIGQQHVVTANSKISITGFHVTKVVARLVILHIVFELILGRAVLLLIALSVATVAAIAATIAAGTAVLSLEDGTSLCGCTVLALGQWSTVAVAGCTGAAAAAIAVTLRGQVVARGRLVALRRGQIVVGRCLRRLVGGQVLVLRHWWLRLRPGGKADEQRNRCKALEKNGEKQVK